MKKHDLLKLLGIGFLAVIVLSWIIPTGYFSNGEFVDSGTMPLGIFDLTRIPLIAIANLVQYGLLVLAIGGLYGVLGKTGTYSSLVEKISKKYKGKEQTVVLVMTGIVILLTAFTGLDLILFTLVPFIGAILLSMGYKKMTAMFVSIGSMLVGRIGSVYGVGVSDYVMQYLGLEVNTEVWVRIILLIMVGVLYILLVRNIASQDLINEKKKTIKKTTKKTEKEEIKEEAIRIPLYEKGSANKKSALPLVILGILAILTLIVAMFNWSTIFGVTVFDDLYTKLTEAVVNGYPLLSNLLGTMSPFGSWGIYDMIIYLVLITPLFGWLYNVKLDDMIDGYAKGAKEVLAVACYAILANVIFATMYSNSSGTNIVFTIVNWIISLTEGFSVVTMTLISAVGSIFFNDFHTLIGSLSTPIIYAYTDASLYAFIGLIFQTIYGLLMMLLPTSVVLVMGLTFFDIPWKQWIKEVWRYVLKIFVIIMIVFVILAVLI